MSLYNFEPFKNMQADNYNLLNISDSEDHPYFFGLGLASKFNCNYGFQNAVHNKQLKRITNYILNEETEQKLRNAGFDTKNGIPLEV